MLRHANALAIAISIAILVMTLLLWWWFAPASRTLQAGGRSYSLELATTEPQQEKGLSGRSSLPYDHGMLFVFGGTRAQCFWMKGMQFPLDIIWTDAQHKVVYIKQYLSPSTYPQTFCSESPANFVIELRAGEASRAGIHIGQVLNF